MVNYQLADGAFFPAKIEMVPRHAFSVLHTFDRTDTLDFTLYCYSVIEVNYMRTLWELSGYLIDPENRKSRENCFRFMNFLLFGLIGLIIWLIVRQFALDSTEWLLCFIGFPAVFCGLFGASIYILNVKDDPGK